jgi:hypothetical protein
MRYKSSVAAALLISVCAGQAALATTQTLTGAGFSVQYNDALVGLFGTPTLVGNSLVWFPSGSPGFSAQSVSGISLTNSTFALQVVAAPGYQLTGLGLFEAGDYFAYAGSGSSASVAVGGQLRATPASASTLVAAIAPAAAFSSSPVFDLQTQDWSATAALALAGVQTVNVSIQNLLAARVSGSDGLAFIEKKEVKLSVMASVVPEHETYVLLLAGLGLVAFLQRRTQRFHGDMA